MTPGASADQALLEELRRHRAELRESMSALEHALAAPTQADPARWAQRVHVALVELAGDLTQHLEVTEGPEGLHRDLLDTAPRLAGAVADLVEDHAELRGQVDDLLARTLPPEGMGVEEVRERGTELLGRLVRHRQRGADLVFDAYEFDVGGET